MQKRKFSSYGTIITDAHYYAPRIELIEKGKNLLLGDKYGGHYITVWASRQSGKSTTLNKIESEINATRDDFDVVGISFESFGEENDIIYVMNSLIEKIECYFELHPKKKLNKKAPVIKNKKEFIKFFTKEYLPNKLILIIDEFDCLEEHIIAQLTHSFREIYLELIKENSITKPLLHGLALIGVRSVLGIENQKGSPFNIQNSLRIPHLTYDEVNQMFHDYIREHNQIIEQDVIDILFYETQGQPGLVSWFGELLTDTYNEDKNKPIGIDNWKLVYVMTNSIPSNNLLNLISKIKTRPEAEELVIQLFQTKEKIEFGFGNELHNYLYLNGIIKPDNYIDDKGERKTAIKFTCQFVHRKIFEYLSSKLVNDVNGLIADPFMDFEAMIRKDYVNIDQVLEEYQEYVIRNKHLLFRNSPRRKTDLQICEAVFHFDLYSYLRRLFQSGPVNIHPEFPTGNGKIDLIIETHNLMYGLELKSFIDMSEYKKAIRQAADYAKSLNLAEITLLFFIETPVPPEKKIELEKSIFDETTDVEVKPRFIQV